MNNIKDIFYLFNSGKTLDVVANEFYEDFCDESLESGMKAFIEFIERSEFSNGWEIVLNLEKHQKENREIAKDIWYDENSNYMKKWMDVKEYPKDHRVFLYIDDNYENLPFDLLNVSIFFKLYLKSNRKQSYLEFLEKLLEEKEEVEFDRNIYS